MEKFEALWAYQTEDIKADKIANDIRRSPTRQRLEKTRDFIVEHQKQHKEIEDEISAMVDRQEVLSEAVDHEEETLNSLQRTFEENPPEDADAIQALLAEVSKCRDQLRQYESEISHIVNETSIHEKHLRTVRVEMAKAKQTFDQLKVDYDNESRVKREELEQQRSRVKSLESSVDPSLLEEYMAIKKHISPPVARLLYGQCSGCNTSLPSATLSKIRNGSLVECETCGRMIIQ